MCYIKYARTEAEYAGLFAELLCYVIAKQIHLNIPENSIIELNHPYEDAKKFTHTESLQPGYKSVGAVEVSNADVLTAFDKIDTKKECGKLLKPTDVIKIALFDTLIGNADRQEKNYNILTGTTGIGLPLYVFDHFQAFDDIAGRNFNSAPKPPEFYKSFIGSDYGFSVFKHIPHAIRVREVNRFFKSIDFEVFERLIDEVAGEVPREWNISKDVIVYTKRYLLCEERLQDIKNQALEYIEAFNIP